MAHRLDTLEFIRRAIAKHGNTYSYAKTSYVNDKTSVIIGCSSHGDFLMMPSVHVRDGARCPKCLGRGRDTQDFINDVRRVHGARYDYSKTIYRRAVDKVIVICREHGEFTIAATKHLQGKGCSACNGGVKITTEEFIRRATKIHGERYDYSRVVYRWSGVKVSVVCRKHGAFLISPSSHIGGCGCFQCGRDKTNVAMTGTKERFIQSATLIHGQKYDYSQVQYVTARNKVLIVCGQHGDFMITPDNHLRGHGCPHCKESLGELAIRRCLERRNIRFSSQHRFPTCRHQRVLPFDFVIYYRNRAYVVEFHGEQHYKPAMRIGRKIFSEQTARQKFIELQLRDRIKRDWCRRNHVSLLVISYCDQYRVEKLIVEFIGYESNLVDFEDIVFA